MIDLKQNVFVGSDGERISEQDLFRLAFDNGWLYIRLTIGGRAIAYTRPPVLVEGKWEMGVQGGLAEEVGIMVDGAANRFAWGGDLRLLVEPQIAVRDALRELLSWSPYFSGPKDMPCARQMEEDADRFAKVPFVSETFLYSTFGKDDARSFLALVNNLISSLGIDPFEFKRDNGLL